MADMIQFFVTVVLIQLFFSIGVTAIVYSMPPDADATDMVQGYQDLAGNVDFNAVSDKFENSLNRLTNTPVVDIGILVFYSGNIILDLLVNFAFATPAMVSMVFNGLMTLWGWDTTIMSFIQIFLSVAMMVVYVVGLLQLITNIRSGRVV